MLDNNKAEFDKLGISHWLANGYTGLNSCIVVLDDAGKPRDFDKIETPFNDSINESKHKTNVCGVVREAYPDCRIVAFNWFGGRKEEIVDWIVEHKNEIDIVNCSFSSPFTALESQMKRIYDAGITIIAASGNNGYDDKLSSPARLDTTIGIGAMEENRDQIAYYSNGGEALSALVYTNIWIKTIPSVGIMQFNGTSCSAPVASVMLAMYFEYRKKYKLPKFTPDESKKFVEFSTRDILPIGFDNRSGHGLFILPIPIPIVEVIEPVIEIPKEVEEMTFKDIDTHWAKGAIEFITDIGLMKGYPDETFQPDRALTRAEYAFMKAKELGYEEVKK